MTDTIKIIDEAVTVTVSETGLQGRPGIVWRGEWSGSVDYYKGDVVKYNGSSFISGGFIAANAAAFPTITSEWSLFTEKGEKGGQRVAVGSTAPVGSCSVDSYTTESSCQTAGFEWSDPAIGDLWFDVAIGRLYALVEDAEGDTSWFDISGVVDTMSADDITVATDGALPSGSLQEVLKHLEDKMFNQSATPTGSTTDEGDLWYDTGTDQMKFLRNGTWEVLVQSSAAADTSGYDSINLNGGYF